MTVTWVMEMACWTEDEDEEEVEVEVKVEVEVEVEVKKPVEGGSADAENRRKLGLRRRSKSLRLPSVQRFTSWIERR